ncbi:MAG TPA: hypothetical protein VGP12_06325 [Nitrosospira sp.]|nr:hypothetical protein [Nitrosospira sp.]
MAGGPGIEVGATSGASSGGGAIEGGPGSSGEVRAGPKVGGGDVMTGTVAGF